MLLMTLVLAMPAAGQKPVTGMPPSPDAVTKPLHDYEQAVSRTAPPKHDGSEDRRQRELTSRLADFAISWNKLIQLAEKGVWNAKQAEKTRKAFDRLVRAEGWIEDNKHRVRQEPESAFAETSARQ